MSVPAPQWQPLRGPERRLPTTAAAQSGLRGAGAVCSACIAGTCCTSEGPIALTAFDVLRLSAALDLAPATFFREFTQDRFDDALGPRYREWLDSAESSVVSFLRRRTLASFSPCIFLKYVAMADGTPRRVCSVHPARPLACREYYHDTCATRWTGELAVLQAEGYEAVRDGRVDRPRVRRELRALGPASQDEPLGLAWRRAFWLEMRRALDPEAANREGAADAGLAALQDPLEDKLNRLLSTPNLRFEEKYGAEPQGEQLHRYEAGLSLVNSGERRRLLRIARRPSGTARMFTGQDYAHHQGHRTLVNTVDARALTARTAEQLLTQELLDAARRLRRVRRSSTPSLDLAALPLALLEALSGATYQAPQASRAALARARKAAAAEALALCAQALGVAAPLDHDQLHGANGLARLLQWGVAPAAEPLHRWLQTPPGRAARRLTGRLVDGLAGPAPATVDAATEWARAAHWLPLVAAWRGAGLVRGRLASCWARNPQLPPEARLTLADHTLRQNATDDRPVPDARWASVCAAARAAVRETVGHENGSMWDARPSLVAGLWYDAYVLRAIEHAGWRLALAAAEPVPDAANEAGLSALSS